MITLAVVVHTIPTILIGEISGHLLLVQDHEVPLAEVHRVGIQVAERVLVVVEEEEGIKYHFFYNS